MAKDKISDYSSTANSNTDIAGINIDEGCAPSGINDAIRTLMAQLKTWQSGGQDVYIHPAGTASAPSITANGDTNTGIFFPTADTVGISTGGTERARVDSSGNMGLGVTPSAWSGGFSGVLEVKNAGSALASGGSGNTSLWANSYYVSGGFRYAANGRASYYQQDSGIHSWNTSTISNVSGAGATAAFTQAMTLDASGNLGIGTTSPAYRTEVVSPSGDNITALFRSGDATSANNAGGGFRNISSATAASRQAQLWLDADGANFGGGDYFYINKAGNSGNVDIVQYSNAAMTFYTNAAERARIDSSGNLLVGKTSSGFNVVGFEAAQNGSTFSVMSASTNASSTNHVYSTGASAYRFYVGLGGTVYATSTTITAISDQRFKENIRDLDDGLDVVMALKPRKFDWKEGKGQDIKDARGFIAQEFEQVLPDMIEEWRDPAPEGEEPYKAINANLIPTLVKAIQEQQAIIETLTARITALEQA